MKANKIFWIALAVIAAVLIISYFRKRKGSSNGAGMKLYCGGSDAHGHNIYTGQPCQTSSTGSYSVSSGGNGIWAFGNNGCYCNTNALPTHPKETPSNLGPITQDGLENIAAGNMNAPVGPAVTPVKGVATL